MLRRRSSGSVEIVSVDRDELLAALGERAGRLMAERREVEEVRLFGSWARGVGAPGGATAGSDVDLLIVVTEADPSPLTRADPYRGFFTDLGLDVWPLVWTREELGERLEGGDPFAASVVEGSVSVGGGPATRTDEASPAP